jgi:hypothetical protein
MRGLNRLHPQSNSNNWNRPLKLPKRLVGHQLPQAPFAKKLKAGWRLFVLTSSALIGNATGISIPF